MKGDIYFTYDALGNKWYKSVETPTGKKGTAYLFGYQYEFDYIGEVMYDWKLMFFPTAEGYVSAVYPDGITGGDPPKFAYVTNIRDHLGNLRMSITRDNNHAVILQERNYYPFGLLHQGYNEEKHEIKYTEQEEDKIFTPQVVAGHYKYWYNGKEWQEDLGYDVYSYGWRNYDPAIGRFQVMDRFTEKYASLTPYHYTGNNPVPFVDVKGDSLKVAFRTGFLGIFGKKVTLRYNAKAKTWLDENGKIYQGKLSKFAKRVLADLRKNQETLLGNEIVSNLANDKQDHYILKASPILNNLNDPNIYYNGSYKTKQKIFEGGKSGEFPGFVVLGHEMAHQFSKNLGVENYRWFSIWENGRGVDEYNAMYYENVLRYANNLPLRVAYAEDNGYLIGRILDKHGNLQPPPTALLKQKAPTMQEIHAYLMLNNMLFKRK